MKLTIKDIAKYLPYGLEIFYSHQKLEQGGNIETEEGYEKLTVYNISHYFTRTLDQFYLNNGNGLLLRPLSQLIEEITHDGKTFVPIVELAKIAGFRLGKNSEIHKAEDYYSIENYYDSTFQFEKQKEASSYSFSAELYTGQSVELLNQETLFQKLYEWSFWTGDQSFFQKGLLIEKNK